MTDAERNALEVAVLREVVERIKRRDGTLPLELLDMIEERGRDQVRSSDRNPTQP